MREWLFELFNTGPLYKNSLVPEAPDSEIRTAKTDCCASPAWRRFRPGVSGTLIARRETACLLARYDSAG